MGTLTLLTVPSQLLVLAAVQVFFVWWIDIPLMPGTPRLQKDADGAGAGWESSAWVASAETARVTDGEDPAPPAAGGEATAAALGFLAPRATARRYYGSSEDEIETS